MDFFYYCCSFLYIAFKRIYYYVIVHGFAKDLINGELNINKKISYNSWFQIFFFFFSIDWFNFRAHLAFTDFA